MPGNLLNWIRGGGEPEPADGSSPSGSARKGADLRRSRSGEGPWLFLDPLDRRWVFSTALLEYDPTLPADAQVRALLCSCEDGWLFAVPVGPDFSIERLTRDEVARLLVVAEGNARQESDWEPSRSEVRTVREPASGRVFQVQVVTPKRSDVADWGRGISPAPILLFQEQGGGWKSSIPLPNGRPIESLSREDLLHLLWPALDLEPLHAHGGVRAERPQPEAGRGSASRLILLVEDHRDLRRIYRFALEQAGFEVIEAGDGADALSLVRRYETQLRAVVTDVVMPGVGGRELLWRLSKEQPGLPVILMSGLLDRRQVVDGMESELVWYLRKPFAPSELILLVQMALGGPASALPQE